MERLLSLVVIRTVHLSNRTSIEYATVGNVPAIEVLRLTKTTSTIGHRHSLPVSATKIGGTPTLAIGQEYP